MKKKQCYENLDNVQRGVASFRDILRWRQERKAKVKDLSFMMPQAPKKEQEFLRSNRDDATLTWIGHATFLVQLSGLNILTDPVWANRMGFVKRMAPPGIAIADLPPIDVVLISHNHYDHLNFRSLLRLPGNPVYLVPEGLGYRLRCKGLARVEEFCWWQRKVIGRVEFTFVPAQHWSKRTLFDTNTSLWGGWVMQAGPEEESSSQAMKCIYFVGDTGYFRGFKEIGVEFKVDYLLMPIGCYEPEWFMHFQHLTPEEAVQAYFDVGAEYFVPMHFEAYRLGDDTPKEALDRLQAAWGRAGLAQEKLKVLKLGETVIK